MNIKIALRIQTATLPVSLYEFENWSLIRPQSENFREKSAEEDTGPNREGINRRMEKITYGEGLWFVLLNQTFLE